MPAFIDLSEKVFGRLTVLGIAGKDKSGVYQWLCECKCGTLITAYSGNLRRQLTQSCGCLRNERVKEACQTHGKTKSPEWIIWRNMRARCADPNNTAYARYGGRGITVCARWLNSFEAFLTDMGCLPTPEYTIERIDNSRGYSPENCRWADRTEQARNTRRNRLITYQGRTLPVVEWAQITGLKRTTIERRLDRGWTDEQALTLPLNSRV